MNDIQVEALLTFVFISTFTPGPNNISSASSGIQYGYRRSLPFILGIVSGFFLMMLGSGILSTWLASVFPAFEGTIRILGALYILWLAYSVLKNSYAFDLENRKPSSFRMGLLLQAINPKVVIFGLSVHGVFLRSVNQQSGLVLLFSLLLAGVVFLATSTWALFGAGIRTWLRNTLVQRIINAVLALLLVFTAIEIAGLVNFT